jgi:thiol-disulfide isomerase/thioredoxin
MTMTLNTIFYLLCTIGITTKVRASINDAGADTIRPQAGKPMPEFLLNHVTHYETRKASLKDFRGKWLFLDFWMQGCGTCIQSFNHVNILSQAFKSELNWVLVGLNEHKNNKNVERFYEKLRAQKKLEMPSAYDSVLFKKWEIRSMPHIIIVDPSGIVRFITDGRDLTRAKIRDLFDGKKVSFFPKDIERPIFNPMVTAGGPRSLKPNDSTLLFSMLTRWNGEEQYGGYDIDTFIDERVYRETGYNFAMVPLYALYNYAYFGRWDWRPEHASLYGKVYPEPILEVNDKSAFDYDFNTEVVKGTYNYNLTLPPADVTKERVMTIMQEDLRRVFKYEVVIETRDMPVWTLVSQPGVAEKLKTKGDKKFISPGSSAAGFTLTNIAGAMLIQHLSFHLMERHKEPFIDATGLTGNIDFTISADMTKMVQVKEALRKQGLDLVKDTRRMKVLIIRDPPGL